ncbi:hypothetical protein [uncultured Sphaerochaeta sp.]|uniref:hypothetical protein n=1 Tax=uncultured Sphaerochaeta sp. TaxID=886478 RepID=UPI0029CA9D84|nr:hypothetical protein [uncultured Sphaerochaeta sp.]MDD4302663.1 hypothetical protein [Sphaerochaeta sp.]
MSPWFIGISGGIISGILVYFITNGIVSKKEKKLYKQKIGSVNFEILQTIRPIIINKERFNNDIFDSIISSLANKHAVATADIYSVNELCNDVITDIIQTPFLTSEQKDEYTANLLSIKTSNQPNSTKEKIIYIKRSSISSKYLSLSMAMTTSLFAMVGIISVMMNRSEFCSLFSNDFLKIFSIGLILISVPIISLMSLSMIGRSKRLRRDIAWLQAKKDKDYTQNETTPPCD